MKAIVSDKQHRSESKSKRNDEHYSEMNTHQGSSDTNSLLTPSLTQSAYEQFLLLNPNSSLLNSNLIIKNGLFHNSAHFPPASAAAINFLNAVKSLNLSLNGNYNQVPPASLYEKQSGSCSLSSSSVSSNSSTSSAASDISTSSSSKQLSPNCSSPSSSAASMFMLHHNPQAYKAPNFKKHSTDLNITESNNTSPAQMAQLAALKHFFPSSQMDKPDTQLSHASIAHLNSKHNHQFALGFNSEKSSPSPTQPHQFNQLQAHGIQPFSTFLAHPHSHLNFNLNMATNGK